MKSVCATTARQRKWNHAHWLPAEGGASWCKDDPNGLFTWPSEGPSDQCHIIAHSLDTSQPHTGSCSCGTQHIKPSCLAPALVLWIVYPGRLNRTPELLEGLADLLSGTRLLSLGLLYTLSIDRNIYDVWLRGYNGVREHSGADWKGRGKSALTAWISFSSFLVFLKTCHCFDVGNMSDAASQSALFLESVHNKTWIRISSEKCIKSIHEFNRFEPE